MKKNRLNIRLHILLLVIAALGFIPAAMAQRLSVKARLDSTHLLMGNMTYLHFEVVQNSKDKVVFPLLSSDINDSGVVGICGDSVELRTSVLRDTIELGSGRIQVNYHVPVQSFDSGYYKLPEFVFVTEKDSASSQPLGLKVMPVPNLTANDSIAPYADVAEPEGKSWLDNVPDLIYYYWWILVVIILLALIIRWLVKKYAVKEKVEDKKIVKERDPYLVALESLENLKQRKLWERGLEKEYFTELTDILREYLFKRFDISAKEMTTGQILLILNSNPETKDKRDMIRRVLDMADFVKFAKLRPLPADNVMAYDNALDFVRLTKPQPVDVKDEKANEDKPDNEKKGGKK